MTALVKTSIPVSGVNGIPVNTAYLQTINSNVYVNREVKYIVLHYTGNTKDTALANAKYFKTADRGASAHYFVDETSIYQSVALKNAAWHCGTNGKYYSACRNKTSIGIEMCCSGNYKVSAKTQKNAAHLVAALCKLLDISVVDVDRFVVRHYDVTHKACPAQWVSNPGEFQEFKEMVKGLLKSGGAENTNTTGGGDTVNVALNVLKNGSKGDSVKALQVLLNGYGYSCGTVDGSFGAKTTTAVKKFQAAKKLTADGIVGATTWEALLK